jgi:hypothetical protein
VLEGFAALFVVGAHFLKSLVDEKPINGCPGFWKPGFQPTGQNCQYLAIHYHAENSGDLAASSRVARSSEEEYYSLSQETRFVTVTPFM